MRMATAFLLGTVFLFSACQKMPEKVVIVGSQWYGHAPAWVAIEKGYFAREGIVAEYRFVQSSTDRMSALTTGSAQFASLGEIAMLSFMAQGNRGFYWVGNQDIAPGFEGIVAQPYIKSVEDLRGKQIAVQFASSVDITAYYILKKHGLDMFKDVKRINMRGPDMIPAFSNQNVDAAAIWEPTFSQLQESVEGAHVLGYDTDTEIYEKFGTMTGPDVLIMSRRFADRQPEKARRLLKAYFEALEWVEANPDETAHVVEKYVKQDPDLIARGLKKFVWNSAREQRRIMSDQGIYRQVDFVSAFLRDALEQIEEIPDYRKWVRLDLLPEE
jgi:ABC-type nitrate/sulfonate/bicarbonate transport system substrate-binding protein